MFRRSFLAFGAALPFVGIKAAEKSSSLNLPKSIPGFPDIKVVHFNFLKSEYPVLEFESGQKAKAVLASRYGIDNFSGYDRITVPLFRMNASGKILLQRDKYKSVPLSNSSAREGFIREMIVCAESEEGPGTMVLVTTDHPDDKNGIGICLFPNKQPHEVFKYGCRE